MNAINPTNDELILQARQLFSSALVDELAATGHAFLEGESRGAFIHDTADNRYLDAYTSAGTCNLGRHRAELVEALHCAAHETDQGNFVLISREKAMLAERLGEFMPDHLGCCYFTVVRGEAMDAACKLARGHTGRPGLVAMGGAWHGDTGFALSLSGHGDKDLYGPLIPGVGCMALNDRRAIDGTINQQTAAVIVEPVQVENGCRPADPDFLRSLEARCRQVGALLIVDETQTGFGRTGRRFAVEHSGIRPDILIFGEAICGGMFNLCGLSFTQEVKRFFDEHPLIHLCTFGGHDVGCRVATAALDLYDRIRPWANAARMGDDLGQILNQMQQRHTRTMTRASAMGLLGGVGFQSASQAADFCRHVKRYGVTLQPGRIDPASVIIRPPLTISEEEMEMLASGLAAAACDL